MEGLLLVETERRVLQARTHTAQGRTRELLDLLVENYPQPTPIVEICQRLNISEKNLLHSMLRNARIFIEIDTLYQQRKPTHLELGKQIVKAVRCQCLFNGCCFGMG
ncbi:hypothetical protein [Vibrio ziniensis]|uniref:Uncharacterized protein n=1 Tax=Vibrio ziniensis TaxID=2711221 RepID=A0A6G7CLH2_9VIBR|nr:hypothetical protein [Vibrio ziniensis]QIH42981.1 hypothetical protein G5S32_13955 [Vibrio ziniensis]